MGDGLNRRGWLGLAAWGLGSAVAWAEEQQARSVERVQKLVDAAIARSGEKPPPNWEWITGGGKQFWSDQLIFHGWRIQKNCYSGHFRLLDDKNVRQVWGTYDQCRDKLAELKKSRKLPPMPDQVVLVLHGILRGRDEMGGLCEHLQKQGKLEALAMSYASSRCSIADHAQSLAKVVESLEGVKEIHFVAHSLGNLVIRHYLHDQTDPMTGRKPDPRIKRIVMIAPPNQGSQLARQFQSNKIMETVWGEPGQEIAQWKALEAKLATPQCEFGIVAGCCNGKLKSNPLVDGDDDLVLAVDETKLPGAADFITVPASHGEIRRDKTTFDYTVRFLREGYFVSAAKKQPLAK